MVLHQSASDTFADDALLGAQAKNLFGSVKEADEDAIAAPRAQLGRALFWDKRVSADGKTACASCHLPEDYGADRRKFSRRATGRLTKRNSQTVFNATLQPALRWTANRKSGTEQATGSLTGSLGLASRDAAVELLSELGYEGAFRAAFPDEEQAVSAENYGRAIEAYEDTLTTPAAFDKFLAGDDQALTARQKAGLLTFMETGCADCHSGPVLGGETLEKFGVEKDYWTATGSKNVDLGRFDDTGREQDKHVFRVALLRNIARTGPYFHDGSVEQLPQAVQIMAEVQLGVALSQEDTTKIVDFLKALTGDVPKHFSPPD
jgi:cytochrome c peroxidase